MSSPLEVYDHDGEVYAATLSLATYSESDTSER